ncbi:hypothetical protein AJ80_07703 [Polytolypa hystricis UAMH7299]|uniref:Uncharacterized protein n=1 Tax=Polytolypa hystricis (strain UAMH7299) TaxID=1447883 RepID=A0A2B7XLI9_POLH7|nr:hypothetical protein AJ80_07703 [Polytolypa hystricis UAMH7299]
MAGLPQAAQHGHVFAQCQGLPSTHNGDDSPHAMQTFNQQQPGMQFPPQSMPSSVNPMSSFQSRQSFVSMDQQQVRWDNELPNRTSLFPPSFPTIEFTKGEANASSPTMPRQSHPEATESDDTF